MELKQGYKKTEVGLIPCDWDMSELSQLTSLMTNGFVGTVKSQYTESDDGVTYIQGYNVEENSFNYRGIKKVTQEFHKLHLKSSLQEGDILTIQTGDVGLTTIVPKELVGSNCHALIISRFKKNKYYSKYFSFYLNSNEGRARLKEIEIGTTMKHINVGDMLRFLVPVPPKSEQTAIAVALSNIDELISQTEKLIDKKKAIKQGVVQELLKPKESWVKKKLGQMLEYEQPTKYIVDSDKYSDNNPIPVLTAGKSFILGYTSEDYNVFENFPVIIFDDFTTSSQFVDFRFKVKSSAMKILKPKSTSVNLKFMFEILNNIHFPVADHKRHWIGEFQNIDIIVPTEDEMNKIGFIIGEFQDEILLIQSKLQKLKLQKQGMTLALLKGKIRLL